MNAADTITDIGKKLRKSVKQGYHPGSKSLEVHPHPNPKSIACFEDEISER